MAFKPTILPRSKAPRMATSHGIFAERGDPWYTQREGDREYPLNRTLYPDASPDDFHISILKSNLKRNLDARFERMGLSRATFAPPRIQISIVDPDMDRWTKAIPVKVRHELGPDKPRRHSDQSALVHAANINLKNNQQTRFEARSPGPRVSEADRLYTAFYGHPPDNPTVKKAALTTGFSVYVLMRDGTEVEKDRKTEIQARKEAQRMRLRRNVSRVEIWSYETGEMIFTIQGRGKKK